MYYKIAQLILTPGQKANSTNEIFVAQPNANKENLAGRLFILIGIESKKADNLKVINFLIDRLNHNYYQNEKLILCERIKGLKPEYIFESALAKTNKNLAEFIHAEKIKLDLSLINVTVGVIYKNSLHFTNWGKNKALIIYKNKKGANQAEYKSINIIEQTKDSGSKKQTGLTKLFTNVVSGSIPVNGYFIFTNEALPEYLSNKQLINIITALPPAGAAEQIKNMLTKINAYVSFLGIIIKNTAGQQSEEPKKQIKPLHTLQPEITTQIYQPRPSQNKFEENRLKQAGTGQISTQTSINGLNTTEETTEKLLTAAGVVINFKKLIAIFNKILIKINPKTIFGTAKNNKIFLLGDKIFLKRKSKRLSMKKTIHFLKNFMLGARCFFKIITGKDKIIKSYNKIKLTEKINNSKYWLSNNAILSIKWFKKLNKKNKILLIIVIICLILLAQNLLVLNLKNKRIKYQQTYVNLIKSIEQKQNQIAANLLYSNEAGAKKLLNEIKKLLPQLPQKTKGQKEQYSRLSGEYKQQLEKIRHVIKIESLTELADFTNLNGQAKPINLIFIPNANNKIYIGDSEQKSIYSFDVTDNLATAITDLKLPIKKLYCCPVADKNNNIYYFNSGSIIKLNTETEEITNLTINLTGNLQNIASVSSFNNRLYLLDKQNNQIYRYNKTADGFTGMQEWIKESVDFSNAVSVSIDGHIYILKSNGELLKFLKGQKQDFEIEIIEPALEQPTKVIISPKQKYIYILEPGEQRLAVFDKTGKFLLQYYADQFTDLKDFTIDETDKKIYFLNGTSIYGVEGTHFEE